MHLFLVLSFLLLFTKQLYVECYKVALFCAVIFVCLLFFCIFILFCVLCFAYFEFDDLFSLHFHDFICFLFDWLLTYF